MSVFGNILKLISIIYIFFNEHINNKSYLISNFQKLSPKLGVEENMKSETPVFVSMLWYI